MTIANQQIVNKPLLYVNNAQITWLTTTTLGIAVSQERDSTNVYDITTASSITLNAATNGLNGLDTGSLVADTWYYIFAIGDSLNYKTHGFIMSTSSTAPTLPFGYDAIKLVGYWRTDAGALLLKGYVVGNGNERTHYWDAIIEVLNAGNAQVFDNVNLLTAVPFIENTPVILDIAFTPAGAGDYVEFRPETSASTTNPKFSGPVVGVVERGQMTVLSKNGGMGTQRIEYQNSAAACATTVSVLGFKYYI